MSHINDEVIKKIRDNAEIKRDEELSANRLKRTIKSLKSSSLYNKIESVNNPRYSLTWRMNEIRSLMNYFEEIGLNNEEALDALSDYNDRFYFSEYKEGTRLNASFVMDLMELFILNEETGTFLFNETIVMPKKLKIYENKLKKEKEFIHSENEFLFLKNLYLGVMTIESGTFSKEIFDDKFRILSKKIKQSQIKETDVYYILKSMKALGVYTQEILSCRKESVENKINFLFVKDYLRKKTDEKVIFKKGMLDNKLKEDYLLLDCRGNLFLRVSMWMNSWLYLTDDYKNNLKIKKIEEEIDEYILEKVIDEKAYFEDMIDIDDGGNRINKYRFSIERKTKILSRKNDLETKTGRFLESIKNKIKLSEKEAPTITNYFHKKNGVYSFKINLLDYLEKEETFSSKILRRTVFPLLKKFGFEEEHYDGSTIFEDYKTLSSKQKNFFIEELKKPENKEELTDFIDEVKNDVFTVKKKKLKNKINDLFTKEQLETLTIVYLESNKSAYDFIFNSDNNKNAKIYNSHLLLKFLCDANEELGLGIDELELVTRVYASSSDTF